MQVCGAHVRQAAVMAALMVAVTAAMAAGAAEAAEAADAAVLAVDPISGKMGPGPKSAPDAQTTPPASLECGEHNGTPLSCTRGRKHKILHMPDPNFFWLAGWGRRDAANACKRTPAAPVTPWHAHHPPHEQPPRLMAWSCAWGMIVVRQWLLGVQEPGGRWRGHGGARSRGHCSASPGRLRAISGAFERQLIVPDRSHREFRLSLSSMSLRTKNLRSVRCRERLARGHQQSAAWRGVGVGRPSRARSDGTRP